MKIGFVVNEIDVPPGYELTVSAHAQIPLRSIALLQQAGHEVHLITTEFEPGRVAPACMPAALRIHHVPQARQRIAGRARVSPLRVVRKLWQIRRTLRRERYDIVHFYGFCRLANMAALVSCLGAGTPIVATINGIDLPQRALRVSRVLWRRIAAIFTSTQYVQQELQKHGVRAHVIKHGGVRELRAELKAPATRAPHRVLFWRDPSVNNGIDVCLAAYRELAPQFPHISFDAAVRPGHWDSWVPRIRELAEAQPNVHLHEFPYAEGVSLAQLLAESICVLLPFRVLSYQPQLSVLESIQFGVRVITTALGSSVELAQGGHDAVLVPVGDVAATLAALRAALADPSATINAAQRAAQHSSMTWNWERYTEELVAQYRRVIERSGRAAVST